MLGGVVFHFVDTDAAGELLTRALARGVNHLDIAPGYGSAEETVGPHIPAVRDQLFIGEKTGRKDRDGVRHHLDRTLRRLGIDAVDLYQLHGVTDLEDLDSRADAVRGFVEAREEGLCRWLGITGHNVGTAAAQREALRRYDLDTVMFPIYPRLWAEAEFRRDAEALLAEAAARDVGVHVIKAGAARPWPAALDRDQRSAATWYEPQADPDGVERGVRFALSTPGVHAFCTPGDPQIFEWALAAAEGYRPLTDDERAAAMDTVRGEDLIFPIPA